jgi:HK97 family phage prohead protease
MSMPTKERRYAQELRASGTASKPRISGFAARYNVKTQLRPGLKEVIKPGAFRESIQNQDDCYCCFNHNEQQIVGRVRSGSLRLTDRDQGLFFDCDIDLGVTYASDLYRNIQNGSISECSFGFYALDDNIIPDDDGELLRELKAVRVFDVSPVVNPQYSGTDVNARSLVIPASVEQRSASLRATLSPSVELGAQDLAWAKSKLELARRIFS